MSLDSRSDELDKKLQNNDIDNSIETLVKDANRRRFQLKLLSLCIALEFVLTIGITAISLKTRELAELAQSNKAAIIQNCETANDSRKNQRQLWGYVLSLPPTQVRTPEQEQRIKDFSHFVDVTFAARDCQAEANK